METIGNLDILKDLYGPAYDDDKLVDVTNMNGKTFYMIGDNEASLFVAGYIVLKDGRMIKIDQSQNHENVISYFLTLYLELSNMCHFGNTYDAIKKLNEYGFPFYVGPKTQYVGNKGAGKAEVEAVTKMFSLYLPGEEVGLTEEQKDTVSSIIESGKEFNSDGFEFSVCDIINQKEYSVDDLSQIYSKGKTK